MVGGDAPGEARGSPTAPCLRDRRLGQARLGADGDLSRGPGTGGQVGSARARGAGPGAGAGTPTLQRTAGPQAAARSWAHGPGSRGSALRGAAGTHKPTAPAPEPQPGRGASIQRRGAASGPRARPLRPGHAP